MQKLARLGEVYNNQTGRFVRKVLSLPLSLLAFSYKSTNIDAEGAARCSVHLDLCATQFTCFTTQFTCFTGTKVQILTRQKALVKKALVKFLPLTPSSGALFDLLTLLALPVQKYKY